MEGIHVAMNGKICLTPTHNHSVLTTMTPTKGRTTPTVVDDGREVIFVQFVRG